MVSDAKVLIFLLNDGASIGANFPEKIKWLRSF